MTLMSPCSLLLTLPDKQHKGCYFPSLCQCTLSEYEKDNQSNRTTRAIEMEDCPRRPVHVVLRRPAKIVHVTQILERINSSLEAGDAKMSGPYD